MVVEQSAGQPLKSTADDDLENLLAKLPVQPSEGCVNPTEVQRRRKCIKLLKPDDLPQVSELLHQKWKKQLTSAPTWMSHLIPKEPPAEFWTAEYYQVMGEFVERSAGKPQMNTTEAELDKLIAKHPVHPRDGCVDPAEIEQRHAKLQQLKEEDIAQVSKLLHEKWEEQRTSAPTWMRQSTPDQPPPELWRSESYTVMGEFLKQIGREPVMRLA